ncbi:ribose-phosphate pyrophosphokinase [Candidatus Parcubacteria bacterium]|nr:ribose-phosphate pyrophosphokinase [Candidatus Parcubacteria bacterium]
MLARKISEYLEMSLGKAKVGTFSDGEIRIEIEENVRNKICYVVQSTSRPVNDNLMELALMIDALKRASANKITAVMPYFGYARQDKKVKPHVPISAKFVADMLQVAGASKVITMDLHAGQIQGFFDIPVDNLSAMPVLLEYVTDNIIPNNNSVIVSPDAGGAERARAFAKRLNLKLVVIDKRRPVPNKAKVMGVIGDVEGKIAILYDDMTDTGGTLVKASKALYKNGAKAVYACATHPVLSGPAVNRILRSKIKTMITADTIPLCKKAAANPEKFKTVSMAGTIGEAIIRDFEGDSVTSLFA